MQSVWDRENKGKAMSVNQKMFFKLYMPSSSDIQIHFFPMGS